MLFHSYLLAAILPLASATFFKPPPVCGTSTELSYKTITVPGANPTTITSSVGDWCWTTSTSTIDRVDCKYTTVTATRTATPTVYITAKPSRTVTRTACVATKTVCANKWKKSEIPGDLTNARRLELGLPPRTPEEEKRWFLHFGPSCTPTTVTSYSTKTVTGSKTTVTKTSCYLTKTDYVYNTKHTTQTQTAYNTVNGPATTVEREALWPATTTVSTTATITKAFCF